MAEFITRTVNATTYKVLVYKRETKHTAEEYFTLPGKDIDDENALKILSKKYNGQTLRIIDIIDKTVISQLRKMSMDFFIANSEIVTAEESTGE